MIIISPDIDQKLRRLILRKDNTRTLFLPKASPQNQ